MANMKLLSVSVILASVLISGCAPVLVGGAAITSATVMTDRRSTGSIVDDEVLEKRVRYEIGEVIGHDKHHIAVTSYEGKVLLTGEVLTSLDKERAQAVATKSVGVNTVINELAVMDPSSVTTLLSDSMLATKVRSAIIGTENISLNQMKVTVQRGIVYLMGIVTPEEAKLASKVAAGVNGVQQVVTCFNVETKAAIDNRLKNLSHN
ncbi:MAG: BON domain-containing protein [Sutterella wadsworthensis]|nr:BON domain-containing protein [Sutterella wadsworthensis]